MNLQDLKYGNFIRFNGTLGRVVTDEQNGLRFQPLGLKGFESYYSDRLEKITEKDNVQFCDLSERIQILEIDFNWGKVQKIHLIGEYQIVEYISSGGSNFEGGELLFHPYIDFKDTHRSYKSLDSALIGVIARKYDGVNSQAAHFFELMIGMKKRRLEGKE